MTVDADHGQVFPEWTFGDKLRKARSIAGLDQREFGQAARLLGVSSDTVRRWERAGRISAFRTPTGHRRFYRSEIELIRTASA